VCSFAGGLAVGFAHYFAVINFVDEALIKAAGSQWPVVLVGGLAGLLGSIFDSLLGATLQFSGKCTLFIILFCQCPHTTIYSRNHLAHSLKYTDVGAPRDILEAGIRFCSKVRFYKIASSITRGVNIDITSNNCGVRGPLLKSNLGMSGIWAVSNFYTLVFCVHNIYVPDEKEIQCAKSSSKLT